MMTTTITLYKWAGRFGPFRIKIPCGECTLTKDIILDVLANELKSYPITVIEKDWLSHWWQPLLKGGWHAPIVFVNQKRVSQGIALNRGQLVQALIEACTAKTPIEGNHLFGKAACPYCTKAKELLEKNAISYTYHDIIKHEADLYQMIARVKPEIGHHTPVTVPQIWLTGKYIGGYQQLLAQLGEPNP